MRYLCNRRVIVSLVANNSNNTDLLIRSLFLGSDSENSPLHRNKIRNLS